MLESKVSERNHANVVCPIFPMSKLFQILPLPPYHPGSGLSLSVLQVMGWACVWLLAWWACPALGFSNGRVQEACGSMEPLHGHSPSPDPAPYRLAVDAATVQPGARVTGEPPRTLCPADSGKTNPSKPPELSLMLTYSLPLNL